MARIEEKIQIFLANAYKGEREVKCNSGIIDILTNTLLIEVKAAKDWKSGVGQLIAYSREYPNHLKYLYLFGAIPIKTLESCIYVCKQNNIELTINFQLTDLSKIQSHTLTTEDQKKKL
jgi:hypothetical protein